MNTIHTPAKFVIHDYDPDADDLIPLEPGAMLIVRRIPKPTMPTPPAWMIDAVEGR